VFEATAKAILDYNGGQGGLALEKIAAIGSAHFNLNLVTQEEVAGRDIAEVNAELLNELSGLRQMLASFGNVSSFYADKQERQFTAEGAEGQAVEQPEPQTVQ
jgi:hypothetical protein